MRLFLLSLLLVYDARGQGTFKFEQKFACGICQEVRKGLPCEHFGTCHLINSSSVREGCSEHCDALRPEAPHRSDMGQDACAVPTVAKLDCGKQSEVACETAGCCWVPGAAGSAEPWCFFKSDLAKMELRVTKGFGTKNYDRVRISMVTSSATPPVSGFFDYSAQFRYKWTQYYLHTALKQVTPGTTQSFNAGASTQISVSLPKVGQGVAGVVIADPCVQGSAAGCSFEKKFQTTTRIPQLINAFVDDPGTDFWFIGGDNFYDRYGYLSQKVYDLISLKSKMKVFATVPGNHDYWALGSPEAATTEDQCGNGLMQYYAMDAKAAESIDIGDKAAPFDFSVDPDLDRPAFASSNTSLPIAKGCNVASSQNFFWYNQFGNVGMIGQSGAYSLAEAKPYMEEACAWASKQTGLEVLVLMGHWDSPGLGCDNDLAMPEFYHEMAAIQGCAAFDKRNMMKFIMGHTHCNDPHPHGNYNTGFRVAGFGMGGCGNFGIPIIDTTDNKVRMWYFDTSNDDLFTSVVGCVNSKGWRQCTGDYAVLWLDQPIGPPAPGPTPSPPTPSPPTPGPPAPAGCPPATNNGGCCTDCASNHYCPSNKGCYSAGQPGCAGGYCSAPSSIDTAVVV